MMLPQLGTRLSYASNIGTVRFVGEVEGSQGIWIGVEWDDPKRGKHSGNKDGKQYFNCIVPNSGSFIRPSASINYGQSFLQALSSKYIESQVNDAIEQVTLGSSNGVIQIEAVGLNKIRDKLSRLENLREVSLDSELVAQTEDPIEITRICPNIKGLDISNNLLVSWTDVARTIEGLPRLEVLSLNQTRLQFATNPSFATVFRGIRELRLNGSSIAWSEALQLLSYLSSLCHLELGYNQIRTLTPADGDIPNLTTLNLEHNALTDWRNVMGNLSMFTSLERLVLSDNALGNITLRPDASRTLPIKHLSLKSIGLTSWLSLDALSSWLPRLQALNAGLNPLFQERSSRSLLIAKVSTLTMLNSSQISSAERRDAELYYLSYISKQGPVSEELRATRYARYKELCTIHGRPSESRQESADTLKKRLIDVECFKAFRSPSEIDFKEQTCDVKISILPSMNLSIFRLKLLKMLKLTPSSSVKLWLVLERDSLHHFAVLDDMSRTLDWLGMDQNCKIIFSIEQ